MYWRLFEGFLLYEGENQSLVVSADRTIDRKKSKFTGNVLSQEEEEKIEKRDRFYPEKKKNKSH